MLITLDPHHVHVVAEFQMIYESSFPSPERRPLSELLADQKKGNYEIYLSLHEHHILGLITLFQPPTSRIMLLDYFAVHPTARSQGLGVQLFRELVTLCERQNKILCLEVEEPISENKEEQQWRRISFYHRAGARILHDFRYVLPDLDQSGITTNMWLMFAGWDIQNTITRKELSAFIEAIFCDLYKRKETDPLLIHNVAHLPRHFIVQ